MVMLKLKKFLPLLCLLLIVGCSGDFKDPEKVIRSFYQSTFIDKNFKRSYKYLSSESQKRTTTDEYQKYHDQNKSQRKIVELSVLPEEQGNMKYRRVKIIYEAIDDKNKTYKDIAYHTLINENGEWKILWLEILYKLAEKQLIKGFYNEAIKQYEEILSINPYDAFAYNSIAWCYSRQDKEKEKEFLENTKKARALEPDNPKIYNTMAVYYSRKKLYSLAIENTKKAISLEYGSDFEKAVYYSNLSSHFANQDDYKSALEAADKAIELDITSAVGYIGKAKATLLSSSSDIGKKEEGKKLFLKALELNEKDKILEPTHLNYIYYKLAKTEIELKDYANAKTYVMKALEIDPNDKDSQKLYYQLKILGKDK